MGVSETLTCGPSSHVRLVTAERRARPRHHAHFLDEDIEARRAGPSGGRSGGSWTQVRCLLQPDASVASLLLCKTLRVQTRRCLCFLRSVNSPRRGGRGPTVIWRQGFPPGAHAALSSAVCLLYRHQAIRSALQDVPAYLLCAGPCARWWRHSGTHTHEVLLLRSKHSRTFWHDAYVLYHAVQSGSH